MRACPGGTATRLLPTALPCSLVPAAPVSLLLQSLVGSDNFTHILRVLNTNVDGKQKIMYALTAIKGIGRRFSNICCKKAEVDLNKRCAGRLGCVGGCRCRLPGRGQELGKSQAALLLVLAGWSAAGHVELSTWGWHLDSTWARHMHSA